MLQKMISIIIVNYNSGHFLCKCLRSINTYAGVNYEVIVVDNDSSDNSVHECMDFFDDVKFKLIKLNENLGFSKANNIGAKVAKGDVIHFLNPDTEIRDGMSSDYQQSLAEPSSIYVNRLQNLDNSFVESKNLIPTITNYFRRFIMSSHCAYWYTGASVIISRNNFQRIGGWNESFFMYSEDLDLFYKAYKQEIKIRQLPSIITHVGGGSSSKVWNNFERELKVQKSFKDFYILNNIKWQYPIILIIFIIRMALINPPKTLFYINVWNHVNFKKG